MLQLDIVIVQLDLTKPKNKLLLLVLNISET
jgi:hypothetical protein